jgi:hypothetical protein
MLKVNHGCVDCGYRGHHEALEFDHISDDKRYNISEVLWKPFSAIIEETMKCEVVCANCHRVRTFARREALRE